MLSVADNKRLTRVGPGTPMGELIRQYWVPAAASSELPEPDCPPMRVRVLGEDLVAFRDTSGRVGLLGNSCPHRGASLFFGRNEENGLRCVYHGWKFDVEGRCIDMPNEPPESSFKDKVVHTAYPCIDRGNIVWAYMGPQKELPPLPQFEFTTLPEDHSMVMKRYQEANWLQSLEGDIDTSHAQFLHGRFDGNYGSRRVWSEQTAVYRQDRHPHLEVVGTDYGVMIGARHDGGGDSYLWRISQFLIPFWTMPPVISGADAASVVQAWVPIDDENNMRYRVEWHPTRPLNDQERRFSEIFQMPEEFGEPDPLRPGSQWLSKRNKTNDYGLDRQRQKTWNYTGIDDTAILQDLAVQESMGAIFDRSQERLGPSDLGIIAMRRCLLRAVKASHDNGIAPPGVRNPEVFKVRAGSAVLPKGAIWTEATRDVYTARPGVNLPRP